MAKYTKYRLVTDIKRIYIILYYSKYELPYFHAKAIKVFKIVII